ncbi:hypothetical protein ASZ90_006862 [hydrocarbon metagenome]|uniref:Uncharacterized protein n=1 Tax=hydrocarbon metagenome TaxID=938273 RepID=A0A0W8FR53_9ZZZZ
MHKRIIIVFFSLFFLSIFAYAQDADKKESVQKNAPIVSVNNTAPVPALQNFASPEIPESKQQLPIPLSDKIIQDLKQIQPEKESNKSQSQKEQQIQSLKPIFPPAAQPKVPPETIISDSKVSPGILPAPEENKSSSDKAPATSATDTKPMMSSPPNTATNKTSNSNGNVSLNFDDADIYSVIQTVFSEILKVNYIIEPKVKGRVTFRSVAPVPKDNVLPVMEVILRLNGVAVIEENSLYRIIPIGDLAREPSAINIGRDAEKVEIKGKALLQVLPVEHVQSSEIVKLITPFVSANAVIVDIPKTNHIIVVDTDANVKRLLQLVTIFDSEQQKNKGPQVFVHHIQNGSAKDIGALLQQIFLGSKTPGQTTAGSVSVSTTSPATSSSSASAPRPHMQTANQGRADVLVSDLVKIYADEIMNAIIILGTPEDYEVIKGTIAKLDIVPRQVLIEGTIAQLQLTDKLSLGLAWSLQTNMFNMNPVSISFNPSKLSSDTSKTSGLSLIGIDSGGSVRAVINALASNSKAKLLASPHIMVSDNREARIQVGQQVPLVTSETYGSSGSNSVPIRTIQYKDIGMILKVKPQINDSGLVALQISQEVSTYSKDTLYADETQIILNKTEASTNLVVQDGQTIVIGGLIREDDSRARGGIPLLSKIPILGYLFGNTENEALRTELVILLTPHVVKNQQESVSITSKIADKITDEKMNMEVKKGIQEKTTEHKK